MRSTFGLLLSNDGISLGQVAEGAMAQQAGILGRLRQLAVQSASGTYGATDRGFMDTEAKALLGEVDRIASVTDFNGNKVLSTGSAVAVQVGINSGDTISMAFAKTDSTTLGVKYGAGNQVDLATSAATASTAITNIDAAITTLSSNRATNGANVNRLNVAVANLGSITENVSAANSRIRDVDVASESSALARNQVLQPSGIAMLSQANQLPQAALSLLQH